MQVRLYDAAVDGVSHDVVSLSWSLRGRLDAAAFAHAFGTLAERHDSLRTSLERRDGAVVQRVHRAGLVPLAHITASQRSVGTPEGVRHVIRQSLPVSFALRGSDPLVKAVLLSVGSDEHVLAMSLHHAIADRWSEHLIVSDLLDAYDRAVSGTTGTPPRRPMQMADYAAWEAAFRGPHLGREGHTPATSGGRLIRFAFPHADPRKERSPGRLLTLSGPTLSPALVRRLGTVASRRRATLHMALCTAVAMALAPFTAGNLRLGVLDANRHHAWLRDVVGCLFDLIPLTVPIGRRPTGSDLLSTIRSGLLAAYDSPGPVGATGSSQPADCDVSINVIPAAMGPPRRFGAHDREPVGSAVRARPPFDVRDRASDRYYLGSSIEFSMQVMPDGSVRTELVADPAVADLRILRTLSQALDASARRLAARPGVALSPPRITD